MVLIGKLDFLEFKFFNLYYITLECVWGVRVVALVLSISLLKQFKARASSKRAMSKIMLDCRLDPRCLCAVLEKLIFVISKLMIRHNRQKYGAGIYKMPKIQEI